MSINKKATREELWQHSLGRHYSMGLEGASPAQRKRFIVNALDLLKNCYSHPEGRDLVSDVVEAVSLNEGSWPLHEPERTIYDLVESVTKSEGAKEGEHRWCVKILQAFLLEFAYRVEKGESSFKAVADLLVGIILDALKKDVDNLSHNLPTTMAYRLALMLAPNFSAIPSRQQRSTYIKLLKSLVRSKSNYNHPFLEDLVLIYKKMDLEYLDTLLEKASAAH